MKRIGTVFTRTFTLGIFVKQYPGPLIYRIQRIRLIIRIREDTGNSTGIDENRRSATPHSGEFICIFILNFKCYFYLT
jgi:hypothetical protein